MTVRATTLLLLAGILLFASAAASAEEDFKAAKSKLEGAFRPDRPVGLRMDAVFAVSLFDSKDAARLLVQAVYAEDMILAPLTERKLDLDEQIQQLIGPQIDVEQRSFPPKDKKDVAGMLRRMRRESAELTETIDKEHQVFEAIEGALARLMDEKAVEYLGKTALLTDKHWRARLIAARAIAESARESSVPFLLDALSDKDVRVKAEVALALGRMRAGAALKDLLGLLRHKNWAVRAAAIEALGGIGEKGAVGPLIEQIEKEEGRLREDCAQALTKLTGQRFGQAVDAWKRWWEAHKGDYGGEDGKPLGGYEKDEPDDAGRGYYGIPVVTGKAIFILDISGSMAKSTKDQDRDPGPGEVSKIEQAKRELARAIKDFTSKGTFNLIVFNDAVKRWRDGMQGATDKNKAEGTAWVKDLNAGSSTNIYDALQEAFRIAGMGATDRHYNVAVDTIFLLSDGSPTKPTGELDDWEKILRAVREWNKLKKVTIHAIGVGGHNMAFMSQLAAENNGRYVSR